MIRISIAACSLIMATPASAGAALDYRLPATGLLSSLSPVTRQTRLWDNAQIQLLNYEFVRERLGGSGKVSYYAGFGPAVGTRIGDERPLYGLAGNARAQYATGGAFAYVGVSGYGLFEQKGPTIGRIAFVAGFGWSFR